MRLYEDTLRLNAALHASGLLPDASRQESHEVYLDSYAALSASNVPDLETNSAVGGDTGLSRDGQQLFWGFPLEQLFFYLQCFTHCGAAGRELQKKIAICNVALPAVQRFRQAFKCGPQHRLSAEFTWPDIGKNSTAAP
ncbi:uncharacterized protein LOC144105334 [Amblyomma americanum]